MDLTSISINAIKANHNRIQKWIKHTPVAAVSAPLFGDFSDKTALHLKLELFQHTGTFKPRGALTNLINTSEDQLQNGITAVSAGNHAIATAFAAKTLGLSAKVVMHQAASPRRVALSKQYGAEVIQMPDIHAAFDEVRRIECEEGRYFLHPFEGWNTALGTAGVGLEFMEDVGTLDAVIVPIGGGGLAAGIAAAVKQMSPSTKVYGVEPKGADTMTRSFAAGKPVAIDKVNTIADSLGAPHAADISFSICQRYIDDIVLLDDDALLDAMKVLAEEAKLAVEPAGAATLAAARGALFDRINGKNVGLIVCGANISASQFADYLKS